MQLEPLKGRKGKYLKEKDSSYKYSPTNENVIRTTTTIPNKRQNMLEKTIIYTDIERGTTFFVRLWSK